MNSKPTSLEILDHVYDEAALVDAEDGTHTAAQMRWAKSVVATMRARLAEKRRRLLPADAAPIEARPIRAWLFGLDRAGLLAKLAELASRGPSIQFAHRNLRGLSDDDLRRIIDLLEP